MLRYNNNSITTKERGLYMTKRCIICDATDTPGMSASHISQHEEEPRDHLEFYVDDDGNTTCSDCFDIINETLREMETEDDTQIQSR